MYIDIKINKIDIKWGPGAQGGSHGIPGWALGAHGPLGTHWPLGTQALGEPLALGDPGPWGPMDPWAEDRDP